MMKSIKGYYIEKDPKIFKGYFKTLAECHISNYGLIVCDEEFHQPIDIEELVYMIEDDLIDLKGVQYE